VIIENDHIRYIITPEALLAFHAVALPVTGLIYRVLNRRR
jgi:hypothetical protein